MRAYKNWSTSEHSRLIYMASLGYTNEQIGHWLKRSPHSVKSRLRTDKLKGFTEVEKQWTEGLDHDLIYLYTKGYTPMEISYVLDRNFTNIKRRIANYIAEGILEKHAV